LVRIIKRNNYTTEEAKQRISTQISLREKCKWADFVIDNSASLQHTREQVAEINNTIRTISQYHGLHFWVLIVAIGIVLLSILLLLI